MSEDDTRLELARQVAAEVRGNTKTLDAIGGTVETIAKHVAADHDTLTQMDGRQKELVSCAKDTATASIRMADLATARAARDEQDREDAMELALIKEQRETEAAGRRWRFVEDNWQKAAVVILIIGGFNIGPLLAYLGMAPVQQVVTVAPVEIAPPVVAPVPDQ